MITRLDGELSVFLPPTELRLDNRLSLQQTVVRWLVLYFSTTWARIHLKEIGEFRSGAVVITHDRGAKDRALTFKDVLWIFDVLIN